MDRCSIEVPIARMVAIRHITERTARPAAYGLLLALVAALLAGCGTVETFQPGDLSGRQIEVVTTIGMIGDVVGEVGGERVEVTTLMGAGVDPHLYKASERDLRTLERADIVFYNGLHLEGGLSYVLEQMARAHRDRGGDRPDPARRAARAAGVRGQLRPPRLVRRAVLAYWRPSRCATRWSSSIPTHRAGYEERADGLPGRTRRTRCLRARAGGAHPGGAAGADHRPRRLRLLRRRATGSRSAVCRE